MRATAHGRILFWEGASLWILSAPPGQRYPKTDPHSHHAIQVTVALRGRVDFDGESGSVGGEAVAIAPDATHAFEGDGLVAHLFVASDGRAGRAIARVLFSEKGPIAPIPPERLGDFAARLRATFEDPRRDDEDLRTLGRALIAQLADGCVDTRAPEPRIQKIIAWVTAHLDDPSVSLSDIAALTGLSPGRARHLFVQQTGLPFRTYLLWLRLVRAVELFADGVSLTGAAYGAGFADSAHLSRTFRRMFGIAAVSLRVS